LSSVGSILNKKWNDRGLTSFSSEMEGCSTLLIDSVDVGAKNYEFFDDFTLARRSIVDSVMKGRTACMVFHVQQVISIFAEEGHQLTGC
jgi:hypothetical protein